MNKIGFILMLFAALFLASCSGGTIITTGAIAPDFSLRDINGRTVSLSDFSGRPVAVNFCGSDWTYCVEEMPLLQQAYEEEAAKVDGVVILTINIRDNSSAVGDFMNGNGYTFPALVDTGGRVARAYGVSAIPVTFLLNRDRTVRSVKRGKFLSINEVNVVFNRIR